MRTDIEFRSGEHVLRGWLQLPGDATGPVPVVVMAHGFGGVKEWLWDGGFAHLEVVLAERRVTKKAVRYRLVFAEEGRAFLVLDERVENEEPEKGHEKPHFYFGYEKGRPTINAQGEYRELQRADIDPTQSILAQRRDPESYPDISSISPSP